jgi:hypothetical protein
MDAISADTRLETSLAGPTKLIRSLESRFDGWLRLAASLVPTLCLSGCLSFFLDGPPITSITQASDQANVWYATSAAGSPVEALASASTEADNFCLKMNKNVRRLNTPVEKGNPVTGGSYQFAFTCDGVNNANAVASAQSQYSQDPPPAPGPSATDMANAYATGTAIGNAIAARSGRSVISAPYATPSSPAEAAPPTFNSSTSIGQGNPTSGDGQFDRGLVSCIQLGRDDSGYYFQNNCGVPANILFACVDAGTGSTEAPGNVNPLPGQRSAAPCFLPRSKTVWVACPDNDGIFGADGHSVWQPGGPYTCKRVWGR